MALYDRLKESRIKAGLTQEQIVEYLFVLTYIVPISAGTSGTDPGAWLQSTGFELTNGGSTLKSGAGCQIRLMQSPSYERKHYIGITKVIGLK